MRVYFDSCIWIDYSWGTISGTGRIKKRIRNLIKAIKKKRVKVISSLFLNTEISAHLRDWFILRRMIRDGFSFREFLKVKRKYNLFKREREKIDKVINNVAKLPWVKFIKLKGLDENALAIFETLTMEYSIDALDALHNIVAAGQNCRFLITKDEDMRKRMNRFLKDIEFTDEFWVCTPEEFLDKLSRV